MLIPLTSIKKPGESYDYTVMINRSKHIRRMSSEYVNIGAVVG